jgi:hypothetical protein
MSRTEVWISREEMVDFLLYEASLEASEAIRYKGKGKGKGKGKNEARREGRRASQLLSVRAHLQVEVRPVGRLGTTNLKDVIDERVEDGHSLVRDTGIGVDLLEDFVDIGRVRLDSLLVSLLLVRLVALGLGSLGGRLFGGSLGGG